MRTWSKRWSRHSEPQLRIERSKKKPKQVLQLSFVNVCLHPLGFVCMCAWHGVSLHAWFGGCACDPLAIPPVRCSPRPVVSAADAAELPGHAQRGGEWPGVAERRVSHESSAELQLALWAGGHHRERKRGVTEPRVHLLLLMQIVTLVYCCVSILQSCLHPLVQVWRICLQKPIWSMISLSIWTVHLQRRAGVAERFAEERTWDLSRSCRQRLRLPPALSAHRQLKIHLSCSKARNNSACSPLDRGPQAVNSLHVQKHHLRPKFCFLKQWMWSLTRCLECCFSFRCKKTMK